MLHVLLLILKIIGIVLLVILGLLLAVLLLALLVPIRYRLDGSYYGKLKGTVRVTWLLHILSIHASYEEEFTASVRILGWNLLRQDSIPDGEEEAQDTTAEKTPRTKAAEQKRSAGYKTAHTEDVNEERQKSLGMEELISLDLEELKDLGIEGEADRRIRGQGDLDAGEHKELGDRLQIQEIHGIRGIKLIKSRVLRRFALVLEKIKFLFKRFCDTLKHIKETYKTVLEFLKSAENQKTLKLILRQLKALLRHVRPRKALGTVVFGFEDPYTTGQVLSAASIFYAWYGQGIELIPMFDRNILEGELRLKGRIRLVTVLYRGLLVYLDKNFRVLLNRWQQRQE